jgi:hypothetical protein
LFLIVYPVIRFIGSGGDRRQALTVTRTSALLFGAVLLFSLAMMALQHIGATLLGGAIENQGRLLLVGLVSLLVLFALEVYLVAWKTAAALGNPRINMAGSIRLMNRHVPWGFGFTLLMMMPLMILHYALNFAAIGAGAGAMWAILVIDSAVAAFLGIVLAATLYRIARRAADRAGVSLGAQERDLAPSAA